MLVSSCGLFYSVTIFFSVIVFASSVIIALCVTFSTLRSMYCSVVFFRAIFHMSCIVSASQLILGCPTLRVPVLCGFHVSMSIVALAAGSSFPKCMSLASRLIRVILW